MFPTVGVGTRTGRRTLARGLLRAQVDAAEVAKLDPLVTKGFLTNGKLNPVRVSPVVPSMLGPAPPSAQGKPLKKSSWLSTSAYVLLGVGDGIEFGSTGSISTQRPIVSSKRFISPVLRSSAYLVPSSPIHIGPMGCTSTSSEEFAASSGLMVTPAICNPISDNPTGPNGTPIRTRSEGKLPSALLVSGGRSSSCTGVSWIVTPVVSSVVHPDCDGET